MLPGVTPIISGLPFFLVPFPPPGPPPLPEADRACRRSLRLSVSDQGPGVSEDRQALIFNAYERAGAAYVPGCGLGLGLYIAHKIVQALGGTLSVRSAPRERPGATFILDLPRAAF